MSSYTTTNSFYLTNVITLVQSLLALRCGPAQPDVLGQAADEPQERDEDGQYYLRRNVKINTIKTSIVAVARRPGLDRCRRSWRNPPRG